MTCPKTETERTEPLELERELTINSLDVLRTSRDDARGRRAVDPAQSSPEDGGHKLSMNVPRRTDDSKHQCPVGAHEREDGSEDQEEEDPEIAVVCRQRELWDRVG